MKKLLAIVLCLALMLPVLALAEGDGRVHITYSFWGNQTEAEAVQKSLDEYNSIQDKVYVMKVADGKAVSTIVQMAPQNNGKEYVVISGLQEGDAIIAKGAGFVEEGTVIVKP